MTLAFTFVNMAAVLIRLAACMYDRRKRRRPEALTTALVNAMD